MEIQQFIAEKTWVKGANYIGSDLTDSITVLSKTRDSDLLTESNFDKALELLGGESETVYIGHFGHWACGWIETIMVKKTDIKSIEKAFEIYKDMENYPVLDDEDYYGRVQEDNIRIADQCLNEFMKDFNIPEKHREIALGVLQDHVSYSESYYGEAYYYSEKFFEWMEEYNQEYSERFLKVLMEAA